MTSGDSEAIEGQGWRETQFLGSELRGGRAESPVIRRPATSPPPPFEELTVLQRSSALRLEVVPVRTLVSFRAAGRSAFDRNPG